MQNTRVLFTACAVQCMKVAAIQSRTFTSQLTEQQQTIQDLTRKFSNEYLKPNAAKHDSEGRFPFDAVSCKLLVKI